MSSPTKTSSLVFALLALGAVAVTGPAAAADGKAAKPYEIVAVTCTLDSRDTNPTGMGLTTCRFVCDGVDKSKVSRVYLSSTAVCPKVVQEKVKQLVR